MLDNNRSAAVKAVPDRDAGEAVIHEARQRFVATFSRQRDSIAALIQGVAELGADGPIDSLRRMLHNIIGHTGGIGFPKVSAGAAAIEALLADVLPSEFDSRRALELAAALRDDFATDLVSGSTDADPGPSTRMGKILVVDDDAQARERMTGYLIAMGYSAIGLPAADSLLSVARNERPDLILLDVGLPGIDGFAACRLLKTEPALSDIPVIFLTAHTDIDDRLTGFALGAEEFLSKPVDLREVKLRIQIQLSRLGPAGVSRAGDDRRQGKSSYAAFAGTARETLQQSAGALALVRLPRDRRADASAAITGALRRRELVGALNSLYLLFSFAAYVKLQQHRRRWTPRALGAVMRSPATPGISLIVPAYNEAFTVVDSVRSLLLLNYPRFEVIVVNDASTDNTLGALVDAFGLVRAPASFVALLPSRSITGVYKSLSTRDLVILDKEQGGKSDALNAGINVARYPLVCVMDADSLLEEHSLTRMVLPFLEDPDTVAGGGIVRIANGCTVESGRIAEVGLPGSRLARFQVVEYLRAFLAGRVAWSLVNGLLIVSGAFGLFRRDVLIEAGGFRSETVTEDMELIVRLHHWCRRRGQRYRIVFQPDPVCWTEAPESLRVLGGQRNRWQRGMLQVLGQYKGMTLNPRYGIVGLVSIPYHLLFEALGPLVEVGGYLVVVLALFLGLLDWRLAQLFFLAAVIYGTLISLAAVLLEELSFRRYPRVSDLLTLTLYGCLENFGYRQLASWWRITGLFDFLRHRQHWGPMTRRGFGTSP